MDERANGGRAFEVEIEAAFAAAPPTDDADAFAGAVIARIGREERRRLVLFAAAGGAGCAVLVQSLAASRDFGGLVSQWVASLSSFALAGASLDPYLWVAAGLTLAAAALIRGVEA